MKYVTYICNGMETAGIMTKDQCFVHSFEDAGLNYPDLLSFIRGHSVSELELLLGLENEKGTAVADINLIAPIPRPHHDIICLGLNYMDHVMESKSAAAGDVKREEAIYFAKRVIKAIGPEGVIDSHAGVTNCLDYEAELAVVIGKDAKGVKKADAWSHVFGLMCFNDVSAREIQQRHKQWYFGKSLDTFTATGPFIASADEFSFPLNLGLTSRVNGETRQLSNTKHMIFPVDYIIEELSSGMTLDAGSIIATGTPAGVGAGFDPPRFMKHGDICEIEIEGCGILKNYVR